MNLFNSVVAGKLAGGGSGGGGGVTSWDDLADKPFGEETITVNEPLDINWDGNTDGLVGVGGLAYKVADVVMTDEQLKLCTFIANDGTSMLIGEVWDDAISEEGGGYVSEDLTILGFVTVVRKAGATHDYLVFPEVGIYFLKEGSLWVEHLGSGADPIEYTKIVITPIDAKYLPKTGGGGGVSSWNDLTDKPFGEDEIVDAVLAYGEYESALNSTYGAFAISVPWRKTLLASENPTPCTVIFDGAAYEISGTVEVPNLGELFGNLALLNAIVGTSFPNTGEPFLGSAGKQYCDLFVMDTEPTSHSVKITAPRKVTKPVPMEYMPSNTYTLCISRDKLTREDYGRYLAKYRLVMDYDTTELVDTILRGGTVYLSFYGSGVEACRVVPNIKTLAAGTSLANAIAFCLEYEGYSKQCFRLDFEAIYEDCLYDITLNFWGNLEEGG